MSQPQGPWQARNTLSPSGSPPPGWSVWLVRLGVFGLLAFGLSWLFPEVHLREGSDYYVVGLSVAVAFVIGDAYARGIRWGEAARNAAIWTAIVGGLALTYTASSGMNNLGPRFFSGLVPSEPVTAGGATMVLTANDGGDFEVNGTVNGARVRFMVDTGASDIVLGPDDARRAGIDTARLSFSGRTKTANGEGRVAYTTVQRIVVGGIVYDDVDVAVNSVPMGQSLLGMSFLRRLKSFQFEDRTLTLRWK